MGQGINQIATELEARTIGGSTASYTENKCVTKQRAISFGCNIKTSTNYTDKQLVKYSDLSKLLQIEDYENKVCVLSVYNTVGQRHLLSGYPLKDSSGSVVEKSFYTRNTFQDPLELSNIIEQTSQDSRTDVEIIGEIQPLPTNEYSFDCCSKDVCVVIMMHGGIGNSCVVKCYFGGSSDSQNFSIVLSQQTTILESSKYALSEGELLISSVMGDINIDDSTKGQLIKIIYKPYVITAAEAETAYQQGELPNLLTRVSLVGDGTSYISSENILTIDFNYYNDNNAAQQNLEGRLGNMNYLLGLQNIQIESYKNNNLTTPTSICPMFNIGGYNNESITYMEEHSKPGSLSYVSDSYIDGNINWPHFYDVSHLDQAVTPMIGFIKWYNDEIVHGFKISWNRYNTKNTQTDITVTLGALNLAATQRTPNWTIHTGEFDDRLFGEKLGTFVTLDGEHFNDLDQRNIELGNAIYSMTLAELATIKEQLVAQNRVSFVDTDGSNFVSFNWDALKILCSAPIFETIDNNLYSLDNDSLYLCISYRTHRYVFLFTPYANWEKTTEPYTYNAFADFVPNLSTMLYYKRGNDDSGGSLSFDPDQPYSNYAITNNGAVCLLINNTEIASTAQALNDEEEQQNDETVIA